MYVSVYNVYQLQYLFLHYENFNTYLTHAMQHPEEKKTVQHYNVNSFKVI